MYVVTCLLLALVYCRIAYTSWTLIKNDPAINNFPAEHRANQRKKMQERKLTTTLGYIFGIWLVCFMPLPIYSGIVARFFSLPYPFGILVVRKFFILIMKLQILINPFVYGTKNELMRRAYRKMFCKEKHGQVAPLW